MMNSWPTSTVLVAMFLGFTIGFLACHKLYGGLSVEQIKNFNRINWSSIKY